MGLLPGQKRRLHKAPLTARMVRLHLLLVNLRRPAGKEDAARGGSRHGGDLARLRCRAGEGEKEGQTPASYVLASGVEEGEGVAGAVRNAMAILESVVPLNLGSTMSHCG
jgi:hypothetical protein